MIQDHQLSERHACRLVWLSRDSYRNSPQPDQLTRDLCERIVDIAHVRRGFGYRRIHDLLRPEFPHVNHKRVYRLYRDANLAVRRCKKAKRPLNERVPLQLAQTVNEVWSMDFVSDSLSNGRRIKCLTVADDFSHECVDIAVDYGISGQYVPVYWIRLRPSGVIRWLYAQTMGLSSPVAPSWPGQQRMV